MKPYGKFLITGVAGSGKTALLNIAGKTLEERGKRIRYGDCLLHRTGEIHISQIMLFV